MSIHCYNLQGPKVVVFGLLVATLLVAPVPLAHGFVKQPQATGWLSGVHKAAAVGSCAVCACSVGNASMGL